MADAHLVLDHYEECIKIYESINDYNDYDDIINELKERPLNPIELNTKI